jgi:hypothetical protein
VFGSLTAIGGGFGGSSYRGYTPGIAGGSGGSGGGASGYNDNAGTFSGGAGTAGQGFRGGNSTQAYYSGGGGGAGGAGADSTNQPNGGPGILNHILGTPYYWGGGGGGASYSLATGGNGGIGGGGGGALGSTTGGAGYNNGSPGGGGSPGMWANTPGGNAGTNTGGGGGGGSHYNSNNKGGDGGSGIVVVRFSSSLGTAIATNGNIVINNDLVMYYDTYNTQKSWKGAPTTNLVNPSWAAWSIDGSGQGSIGTRTITSLYECLISDTAANTRQNAYVTGIAGSTTYTFSVQYKKVFGSPTLRFQLQSYNGGTFLGSVFPTTVQLGLTDKEGWQTAFFSYTTSAGADRVLWFMQDGDDYTTYTHSFILANVQCEQRSFATPFVAGTRSNTQAILDLTNNSTITANSLTYASNIAFSFNGSNYASVNAITGISNFTVEVWFKSDSVANYRNPIDCNWLRYPGSYSNVGPRLEQDSAGKLVWITGDMSGSYEFWNLVSSGLNSSVYHCACLTKNGNTFTSFYNGSFVESRTASYTWPGDFNNVNIGRGFQDSGERWFIGQIPSVKIYNGALSAAEVQQNFNAQRTRYGI